MAPKMIIQPTRLNPEANDMISPIKPIRLGTAPPPIIKARGAARDTAMLLAPAGPIRESAAKPAGKKHTASIGCRKIAPRIHLSDAAPMAMVVIPLNRKTIIKVLRGPNRSEAHPPASAVNRLKILEKDSRVFA